MALYANSTQRNNNKNQYSEEVLCRHTTSTVEEFTTRTTTLKNNNKQQPPTPIYIYDDLQYIISLLNKKMVTNILQHSTAPITKTGHFFFFNRISSFICVCLLRGEKEEVLTRTFAHVSCCPVKISVLFNFFFFFSFFSCLWAAI